MPSSISRGVEGDDDSGAWGAVAPPESLLWRGSWCGALSPDGVGPDWTLCATALGAVSVKLTAVGLRSRLPPAPCLDENPTAADPAA